MASGGSGGGKTKSAPQDCRNNCGMMIYFDFINPEGRTQNGKYRPLAYYDGDSEPYSGTAHDCPKSDYNLKRQGQGQGQGPGAQQYQQRQQREPQPQPQGQSRYETSYLIPRDDWDKVLSNISAINFQIERLSQYYGDLLDHVKTMSHRQSDVDEKQQQQPQQQELADAELVYDTDREDGSLAGRELGA